MTQDEFAKKYHNYSTRNKKLAVVEVILVNREGIDGDCAVVVGDYDLGYFLMLKSVVDYIDGKE